MDFAKMKLQSPFNSGMQRIAISDERGKQGGKKLEDRGHRGQSMEPHLTQLLPGKIQAGFLESIQAKPSPSTSPSTSASDCAKPNPSPPRPATRCACPAKILPSPLASRANRQTPR